MAASRKAPALTLSPFTGFSRAGIDWFRGLALAQNREWFQAHRDGYEALWLTPMKSLLAELEKPLAKLYRVKLAKPKIFRLNRDVRFSKDKTPYKTNISAMFGFEGQGGPMGGPVALYFHLGLDEMVGAGFYALEPAGLQLLRKRILDDKTGPALQKLVDGAATRGLELSAVSALKRAPVGVPVDHPRIQLLKHRGLALTCQVPKRVRFSKDLAAWLVDRAEAAAPVVRWGLAQKLTAA